MSPNALLVATLALTYTTVLVCSWVEERINIRAAIVAQQRSRYDPTRPAGKRGHQGEE